MEIDDCSKFSIAIEVNLEVVYDEINTIISIYLVRCSQIDSKYNWTNFILNCTTFTFNYTEVGMLNEVRVCSVESGSSLLAQRDLKVVNKAIQIEVNKLKEKRS